MQIALGAKPIADKLTQLFGAGAHNKTFPIEWLGMRPDLLAALLRGMFLGDGCISMDVITYITVSEQLARRVVDGLRRLNIACSLGARVGYNTIRGKDYVTHSWGVSVNDRAAFYATIMGDLDRSQQSARRTDADWRDDGCWLSARESHIIDYKGAVWNIEVDGDESYVAEGIAVHNCWILGESFKRLGKDDEDGYYRHWYDKRKAFELTKNENGDYADQAAASLKEKKFRDDTIAITWYKQGKLPPGRIDRRAARWTVKLFLSHLHQVWWMLEFPDKPYPKPYAIGIMGHVDEISPPNLHVVGLSRDT